MPEQTKPTKPTVRMSPDEAWALLESSLVGILPALRRDGRPVALAQGDRGVIELVPQGKLLTWDNGKLGVM